MIWHKTGCFFHVSQLGLPWAKSHTQVPIALPLDDRLRIWFGTRDEHGHTHTTWIDVELDDPSKVMDMCKVPALSPGRKGMFDDCGTMPSSILKVGRGDMYLYYTGWARTVQVPYHLAIGLALSRDEGKTFVRVGLGDHRSEGPIMDRGFFHDPIWVSQPYVRKTADELHMYYLSCTKWDFSHDVPESCYHIKYAKSRTGIVWDRTGIVSLELAEGEGGITRPIIHPRPHSDGLRCWYCYRGRFDFRLGGPNSYRIGYAESRNGIVWDRKDDIVGINVSGEGWDSEMIAYPWVYEHDGRYHMIYNGNGFGQSGLGHAWLEE